VQPVVEHPDVLEQARIDVGLSVGDLWYRYFALGGMGTVLEVEGYLLGALVADGHDHDLLAVALNERFSELGGDHPVAYADDQPGPP
jgi:hypothetical protein